MAATLPQARFIILEGLGGIAIAHHVTSFKSALLAVLRIRCPEMSTALLFPRSEPWMQLDVVAYVARQRARQAHAAAVHLHPTQLTKEVVSAIRAAGADVHAWDVNDTPALELVTRLELPWADTNNLENALRWRAASQTSGSRANASEAR